MVKNSEPFNKRAFPNKDSGSWIREDLRKY